MNKRIERIGESVIVYDDELASQITESWFDPGHWPNASLVPDRGRGRTFFVAHGSQSWVVRHYYRGGMASRLLTDRYVWLGERQTRSFGEWGLLRRMTELGLPVPRPVAARYVRSGVFYTADLITVRIPDVQSLARCLANGELASTSWANIGELVARFHAAGIDHADLNAHNIQINSGGELFLLDFDRGCLRSGPGSWTQRNLERLHRSLRKIKRQSDVQYSGRNWNELVAGYRSALSR